MQTNMDDEPNMVEGSRMESIFASEVQAAKNPLERIRTNIVARSSIELRERKAKPIIPPKATAHAHVASKGEKKKKSKQLEKEEKKRQKQQMSPEQKQEARHNKVVKKITEYVDEITTPKVARDVIISLALKWPQLIAEVVTMNNLVYTPFMEKLLSTQPEKVVETLFKNNISHSFLVKKMIQCSGLEHTKDLADAAGKRLLELGASTSTLHQFGIGSPRTASAPNPREQVRISSLKSKDIFKWMDENGKIHTILATRIAAGTKTRGGGYLHGMEHICLPDEGGHLMSSFRRVKFPLYPPTNNKGVFGEDLGRYFMITDQAEFMKIKKTFDFLLAADRENVGNVKQPEDEAGEEKEVEEAPVTPVKKSKAGKNKRKRALQPEAGQELEAEPEPVAEEVVSSPDEVEEALEEEKQEDDEQDNDEAQLADDTDTKTTVFDLGPDDEISPSQEKVDEEEPEQDEGEPEAAAEVSPPPAPAPIQVPVPVAPAPVVEVVEQLPPKLVPKIPPTFRPPTFKSCFSFKPLSRLLLPTTPPKVTAPLVTSPVKQSDKLATDVNTKRQALLAQIDWPASV